MATDITTQLIKAIGASSTQAVNSAVVGSSADLLSTMANYVQILSTVEGPAVQFAVAKAIGEYQAKQAAAQLAAGASQESQAAAAAATGAAAEGSALAVAGASLVGAFILLAVSFILAELGDSGESDQTQQFAALVNAVISDIDQHDLEQYWETLLTGALSLLWSDVSTDLDNLAAEGTGGTDVLNVNGQNSYVNFHNHASKFVNLLIADPSSYLYWQVPSQYAGTVPQALQSDWDIQPSLLWQSDSWYGQFPARPIAPDSPSGDDVSDPTTMLPLLALGLQSYLTLESVLNIIDPSQPTLLDFVNTWRGDPANWQQESFTLSYYTNFLFTKYALAVNGILKTDLPTDDEILGALWKQEGESCPPFDKPRTAHVAILGCAVARPVLVVGRPVVFG